MSSSIYLFLVPYECTKLHSKRDPNALWQAHVQLPHDLILSPLAVKACDLSEALAAIMTDVHQVAE